MSVLFTDSSQSKSFLAFSLKCLASFMTIQPSSYSVAAAASAAATMSAHHAQSYVDAATRIHTMADDLGPQLSRGALVYVSGSDQFDILTERWQLFAPPIIHRCCSSQDRAGRGADGKLSLHRRARLGNQADSNQRSSWQTSSASHGSPSPAATAPLTASEPSNTASRFQWRASTRWSSVPTARRRVLGAARSLRKSPTPFGRRESRP